MASALFSTDHTTLVVSVQKPGGELGVTTNAGGPPPSSSPAPVQPEGSSSDLLPITTAITFGNQSEPDMQISRIRLSDKTSRLHPRHVVPKRGQASTTTAPVPVTE